MIILKNKKFIYFHLTDTPNAAQDTTSYSGYTVKIKAPMSIEFYGVGSGSVVPLIGNDSDTFLVTTTEMLVNSRFIDGEVQKFDIRTGAEIPYLTPVYNEVRSYGVSSFGSRTALAIQYFSPDGVELVAPFRQTYDSSATSTYSATCNEAGELVIDSIDFLTDLGRQVESAGLNAALIAQPPAMRMSLSSVMGSVAMGAGALGAEIARRLANDIAAPVAAAIAEGLCESLTKPDVLPVIEVGFNSPDLDSLTSEVVVVCDEITSEYVGSSGTIDDNGDVTVIGHKENVCSEWHHEVVS